MNCGEFGQCMHSWFEDTETPRVPSVLTREQVGHLADCQQCRIQYETLKHLFGLEDDLWPVPASLEQTVLDRIHGANAKRPAIQPRQSHWFRPGLAIAAGLAILLCGVWLGIRMQSSQDLVTVHLRFEAPGVQSVAVAGDWNDWNPQAGLMTRINNSNAWEIIIQVKKGVDLRYQFVIDQKKWLPDPLAPIKVQDEFGGTNSILHI